MRGEATDGAFVHLQVHSCYSFFDSTLTPEDIVRLAAESGAGAVALTDTNCLTGAVVFYKAALAAGLKPILGAEVRAPFDADRESMRRRTGNTADEGRLRAPPMRLPGEGEDASTSPPLRHGDPSRRMVLLARDFAGYSEISHLITRRMLDAEFDIFAEARRLSARVIALSDCPEVLEALAAGRAGVTYGLLIPSRRLRARNREVYECARRLGIPQAVACDVKMASPDDVPLHDLLQAMRRLTTIHRLGETERIDPAQHYQSGDSVRAFFGIRGEGRTQLERELLASMRNTARIAAQCDCRLPLCEWKFPRFKGLSGRPEAMLRELVERGVRERYGTPPPPAATERAERELEVIAKLHFTDYFLLVNRIVDEAHERGFFTVGRGSGANSIISYVLGITGVCPIRHNLYFERFLNPERNVPPDIDIDFSWRERDEIIQWCFDFFGPERVALISTLQTLQMRQAVREVAKAHGIGEAEVNAFNRLREVGYRVEAGADGAQGMQPMRCWGGGFSGAAGVPQTDGFHDISADEPWRTIMEQARRIADFPRHLSIHCGGILIAPGGVSDFVPLTRSAKGFVITQMDMYSIEDLGLVKIDLLSNRSLGVLKDGLAMAEKTERERERRGIPAPPPYGQRGGETGGLGGSINAVVFQREAQRIKLAGTRRGTSVALAGVLQAFGGREGAAAGTEAACAETHAAPDGGADALMPCVSLVRQRVLDFEHVTNDPATRAMIDTGDTMGCFYIESPGMRALFERLRCRSFQEVVAASSIIRPGVAESGMMQEYITRHKEKRSGSGRLAGGGMPVNAHARGGGQTLSRGATPPHPLMLELLPETYGVMVYQEDVLKVAHDLAGMSFAEADLLRRAMSGKMRSSDAMAQLHDKFIGGAAARGVAEGDTLEIWRQVSSFAGYSFCKGHSAAFAVLSYQVSYLKAHYPAEFFAAVLANEGGFYGPGAYIEEARRHGVRTLPPCVNESGVEYTGANLAMEVDAPVARGGRPSPALTAQPAGGAGWMRVGLRVAKGVRAKLAERIVHQRRKDGPYRSLGDFAKRTGAMLEECRTLVKAGAFDFLAGAEDDRERNRRRPSLLLEAECLFRRREICGCNPLLETHEGIAPVGDGHLLSLSEMCRWETEALGFMLGAHPLDFVRVEGRIVAARDIRCHSRRRIRMVGWMISAKLLSAKNSGRPMKMLSMEDRSGTFEAVLFPRIYEKFAPRTLTCGPFLLEGKVDVSLGSPTLNVDNLTVLRQERL